MAVSFAARIRAASPARPGWRPLLRTAWRLERTTLAIFGVIAAAAAAWLIVRGLHFHSLQAALSRDHCSGTAGATPACGTLANRIGTSPDHGPDMLNGLPVLTAMFVGAPLFARDLQAGTLRFLFTQGTSRGRWVAARLAVAAAVCVPVACALGVLASWWLQPFRAVPGGGPWWPGPAVTMLTPLLLAGWTLLGLVTGAAIGLLIRSVPAVATAGVVTGGLAWLTAVRLRGALLSIGPLAARTTPGVSSSCSGSRCAIWVPPARQMFGVVSSWGYTAGGWFTGPGGHRLGSAAASRIVARVPEKVAMSGQWAGWLAARHLAYWVAYQPASRYWVFQFAEAVILLLAAALLLLLTMRLARKDA
jgi:hypothetical protein